MWMSRPTNATTASISLESGLIRKPSESEKSPSVSQCQFGAASPMRKIRCPAIAAMASAAPTDSTCANPPARRKKNAMSSAAVSGTAKRRIAKSSGVSIAKPPSRELNHRGRRVLRGRARPLAEPHGCSHDDGPRGSAGGLALPRIAPLWLNSGSSHDSQFLSVPSSSTCTVWRLRKRATMMARPTATSAAATVMMKKTKTLPSIVPL